MIDQLISGLVVRSDIVVPGTPEHHGHGEPDLVVERVGVRAVPSDIAAGTCLQAASWGDVMQYSTVRLGDGTVLLRLHGLVEFVIGADLGTVEAWVDPACDTELYALLLTGNLVATVLMLRGETALHASAVEVAGRAVAFVAHSGMGKSTLAALACTRGARFVGDDLLRVQHGADQRVRCWPGSLENRLRRPLHEILGTGTATASRESVDGRQVWSPPATRYAMPELVAVVLPELDREASTLDLRPVRPGAALMALASRPRLLGWVDRTVTRQVFDDLAAIVRAVPVLTARVPWSLPIDPDLIDALLVGAGLMVGPSAKRPLPVNPS